MRQIRYIFIDSDCDSNERKSERHDLPYLCYHYIVTTEGIVIPATDLDHTVALVPGPVYNPDKYNRCSVTIRYCGFLGTESTLANPDLTCTAFIHQRKVLLDLLVELRARFFDAFILGVSEINGKDIYSRNIIVSDTMNILRRELSDLP